MNSAKTIQADEAGGVVLVVGLCRVGLHRGDMRIVETELGLTARRMDAALVELHPHRAADVLLALCHQRLERETFRSIPETIVHQLGILRHQAVAQMHDFAVHGQRLDLAMREMQDRSAGCFIHATACPATRPVRMKPPRKPPSSARRP